MPTDVPNSIFLTFIAILVLTTFFMFWILYSALKQDAPEKASKRFTILLVIFLIWTGGQAILSFSGFYNHWDSIPPRFALLILPTLITIILVLSLNRLYQPITSLSLEKLTYLQFFRFPLELFILSGFYWAGIGPKIITFEGRNFDIVMGLTAPVVAYLCFRKGILSERIALIWNVLSFILVVNVVTHAFLSTPTPLQQFSFDRPITIVAHFPYIYLPSVLVPIALFSSLFSIKQLWNKSWQLSKEQEIA